MMVNKTIMHLTLNANQQVLNICPGNLSHSIYIWEAFRLLLPFTCCVYTAANYIWLLNSSSGRPGDTFRDMGMLLCHGASVGWQQRRATYLPDPRCPLTVWVMLPSFASISSHPFWRTNRKAGWGIAKPSITVPETLPWFQRERYALIQSLQPLIN